MLAKFKEVMNKAILDNLFEPNDKQTRSLIIGAIIGNQNLIKSGVSFEIVCDESNNPPQVIDDGEIIVDVYIKPRPCVESITVRSTCSEALNDSDPDDLPRTSG